MVRNIQFSVFFHMCIICRSKTKCTNQKGGFWFKYNCPQITFIVQSVNAYTELPNYTCWVLSSIWMCIELRFCGTIYVDWSQSMPQWVQWNFLLRKYAPGCTATKSIFKKQLIRISHNKLIKNKLMKDSKLMQIKLWADLQEQNTSWMLSAFF